MLYKNNFLVLLCLFPAALFASQGPRGTLAMLLEAAFHQELLQDAQLERERAANLLARRADLQKKHPINLSQEDDPNRTDLLLERTQFLNNKTELLLVRSRNK